MVEVHGWATIRCSPAPRDDEDEAQQRTVAQVAAYIRTLGCSVNPLVGRRWMNGQAHVWVEGFRNHAAGVADEVRALFQSIAQVAPGSYGLLYTLDDEDAAHNSAFGVWVLARGALVEHADPFFSPIISVVEDPYGDD